MVLLSWKNILYDVQIGSKYIIFGVYVFRKKNIRTSNLLKYMIFNKKGSDESLS